MGPGPLPEWVRAEPWAGTPRDDAISVAIPTYRRAEPLLETLRSLLAGTVLPLEVLVIDQTEEQDPTVLATLAHLAPRVGLRHVLHQPPGLCGARNRALREARGDVILFLDDDVTCEPHLLAAHRRHYDQPTTVAVAGRVRQPAYPEPARPQHFRLSLSGRLLSHYDHDRPERTCGAPGGNFSFRRACGLAAGGYDERFVRGGQNEDCDFGLRLARRFGPFIYDPAAALIHHVAPRGGGRAFHTTSSRAVREYFRNESYFMLRHLPRWRLPLYLGRQLATTGRVALGRYQRVFPGYRPGLRGWPAVARACLAGLLAGAAAYARARGAGGPLDPSEPDTTRSSTPANRSATPG